MAERPLPPMTAAPLSAPEGFALPSLDQAALPKLGAYLANLLATNEIMNLTAVTDPAQAWQRHIADSLTLLGHLPKHAKRLIDIGSGGGLPGIPLAIARPDLEVTLVESTKKKAQFLEAVAAHVGATNVKVKASRAENLQLPPHAGAYDVVTARAVARLTQLLAWTVPFAKKGGTLLLIKGQQADEELAEAAGVMADVAHVRTVQTETGRIIVLSKL